MMDPRRHPPGGPDGHRLAGRPHSLARPATAGRARAHGGGGAADLRRPRPPVQPGRRRPRGGGRGARRSRRLSRQEHARLLRAAVRGEQGRGGDGPRELAPGAGGDRRHPRRLGRRRAGGRAGVRRDGRADGRPPAGDASRADPRSGGVSRKRAVRALVRRRRGGRPGAPAGRRRRRPAAVHVGDDRPAEGRDAHQPQRVEHAPGDVAGLGVRRGERQPRGAAQLPRRWCRVGARRPLRRRVVGGAARVRRRRGAGRDLRAPCHARRAGARRAARPAGGGGQRGGGRQLVGGARVRRLADRRERARRGGAHAPVRLHPGVRADRDGRRRDPAARRRPRPGGPHSTGCARRAARWKGSRCASSSR